MIQHYINIGINDERIKTVSMPRESYFFASAWRPWKQTCKIAYALMFTNRLHIDQYRDHGNLNYLQLQMRNLS